MLVYRKKIALIFLTLYFMNGWYVKSTGQNFRNPDIPQTQRIYDLLSQLTIEEKVNLLIATSEEIPRLGIDKYYHGNEALHGIVRPGRFTVFPQAIGLAATWNPELIFRVATAASDEARAKWNFFNQGKDQKDQFRDLLTFWSPTVNMARDPRWGRTPETYGEDPYLTGTLGVQFVRGLQGDDPFYLKVVSTPKHFAANNEEHNRFTCNAKISETTLREYYLEAFRMLIVDGKARSIMSAYNAINDVPCTANKWLLTDLLRGEWDFNGYVVSDCGAVGNLLYTHKYAETKAEAAKMAIQAGVDLECGDDIYKNNLIEALQDGLITQAEIDTAAYRVLRSRFELGILDPVAKNPYTKIPPAIIGCEKHQKLALEAARQSIVLLKNENNLLPIDKSKYQKIAVLGPNAASAEFGDYSGIPVIEPVTPLDGMKNKAADTIEIIHIPWKSGVDDFAVIENNFLSTDNGESGLRAEIFAEKNLIGPAQKRIDAVVNFDPANQPPDPLIPRAPMSIRWTGYLCPKISGDYRFAVKTDDGVRMWINDDLIIDAWLDRGPTLDEIKYKFTAGEKYKLKIEYYDSGGGAVCQLLWEPPRLSGIEKFAKDKKAAAESDLVIAVLGINKNIEREGIDRETIDLPAKQREYIKEIYKINKNIIVVLVAGSAQSINWINDNIPAVVNAWYPGESGGTAIADVLFGDYNPAGRLPFTYYKSVADLPPFDDYEITHGRTYMYFEGEPLYPFGYGKSYTTFSYSNFTVDKQKYSLSDKLNISVEIENTGDMDGDEVVQLYVRDLEFSVKRPIRELKGFKRIHIKKGESKTVRFKLPVSEFKFWDTGKNSWRVEPGEFEISVGGSSRDIKLSRIISVI
ncbi:glycoside hydrolase family 3 C-terminal domain-containing protein [candidate division KSB1 bacterium]|nr:glycoside hydrolase family 3 C-terminal domain-containing protein [candidate division KSB1 bacterium]